MSQDNTPAINIDDSLVQEFIDESMDMLCSLDARFIELEEQPGELLIIEAIFRPVHSIKGNSGFFGFVQVKHLAHELETLLDLLRKSKLVADAQVINILLEGMDALRRMFARVKQGQGEIDAGDNSVDQIIAKAQRIAKGDDAASYWQQVTQTLDALSLQLQSQDDDFSRQFQALATLLCKLNPVKAQSEQASNASTSADHGGRALILQTLEQLRTKPDDQALIDTLIEQLHHGQATTDDTDARHVIDEILETLEVFTSTIGLDDLAMSVLDEKLNTINPNAIPSPGKVNADNKPTSVDATDATAIPAQDGPKKPVSKANKAHETLKTMRVSEACIDKFLEYVGDLIVVGDMYSNVYNMMIRSQAERTLINTLKRTNETFGSLSQQLQESIMSIRCVPVGTLLQKVPRLVRDVAKMSGKDIAITVTGDQVEMDKSLVDLLDAPLVHMVRNAADHGIENPEVRKAAGKPPQGHISVIITESDSRVVLTITDDGAGIRLDKIKAKAESLGIISPGANLSEEDLINCLFASGVSTAEQITDVSGRGVGMDVVKRMIDDAGGNISIKTELGKGSTFTVELPKSVTTQIMSAYLLEVAGQKFALPLNCIQETVCIDPGTVKTVMQLGQLTYHNGSAYPLVDMKTVLGIKASAGDAESDRQILVLVKQESSTVAVKIDHIVGIQQIVLCKIDGMEDGNELIQGGAQMGDGTIVLILNPENLHTTHAQSQAA
jgi:two-component system chemotaxis sensor kinase CheA